jgi:hypothetical protein
MTMRFLGMDLEPEDWVAASGGFSLLVTWFTLLTFFKQDTLALWVFWIGLSILSAWYSITYFRKKRDKRLYKIRFVFSAMPNYIAFGIYGYSLLAGIDISASYRFLPIYIITCLFVVNITIFIWATQRKNPKEEPI